MTDPLNFTSASPRFGLPLLFAGQAQKEFIVNEAHALTDALLHCAIENEAAAPPATAGDGNSWLVGAAATGEWASHDGEIACRQAGAWLFVVPRDGLRIFNRASGQLMLYAGGWQVPTAPMAPSGGATVDAEARTAIDAVIGALRDAGILPAI